MHFLFDVVTVSALDSDIPSDVRQVLSSNHHPVEGEPDFVETNCHWGECKREFETQEELVRVGIVVISMKSFLLENLVYIWSLRMHF